jgi:alpha-tubulin suppressor-like RCC1 family protein
VPLSITLPPDTRILPARNSQIQSPLPTLFVWGSGDDGQFGLGADNLQETPTPQRCLHQTVITSVAAGGLHTLFLDKDGKAGVYFVSLHRNYSWLYAQVWSCGNDDKGALGRETGSANVDELVSRPYAIPDLESREITTICAKSGLSAAVTTIGELFVWGTVRVSPFLFPHPHEHTRLRPISEQPRIDHPAKRPGVFPGPHQTLQFHTNHQGLILCLRI